jgi:hypothetical protein
MTVGGLHGPYSDATPAAPAARVTDVTRVSDTCHIAVNSNAVLLGVPTLSAPELAR